MYLDLCFFFQSSPIEDTGDLDGCIWLSEEQLDELLAERGVSGSMLGEDHKIAKRSTDISVAGGGFKKWPNAVVPYKFDGHSKL